MRRKLALSYVPEAMKSVVDRDRVNTGHYIDHVLRFLRHFPDFMDQFHDVIQLCQTFKLFLIEWVRLV